MQKKKPDPIVEKVLKEGLFGRPIPKVPARSSKPVKLTKRKKKEILHNLRLKEDPFLKAKNESEKFWSPNGKQRKLNLNFIGSVMDGNYPIAESCLRQGANINAKVQNGKTALMYAALFGHADIAEKLLKGGAHIDEKDGNGKSALMYAAGHGSVEALALLIKKGARVNARNEDGYTALMFACSFGRYVASETLIKNGANVNAKGYRDNTALTLAVGRNHRDLVQLLINSGANVNLPDVIGRTPLDWASDNEKILELLHMAGAKE